MTTADKVAKMRAWFDGRELPAGAIPYAQGEVIFDARKFLATQFQMLEGTKAIEEMDRHPERTNGRVLRFRNAYMRLYQLKSYIESCPKNA